MKLQHGERRRKLRLVVQGILLAGLVGFLPANSLAAPDGRKASQDSAQSPKDNPPQGAVAGGHSAVNNDVYTVGPADVLKIDVWQEPEVSSIVAVRPDGKISLPLIGDINASGYTPNQLQDVLAAKLHAFIANPEVSVTVQEVKSRKFNVLGEVQHPGSYSLAQPVRILDAIGMAGGFRDFAKVSKIYVLRRSSDGGNLRLPFNYKQVIQGNDTDQNVELEPGDTVVVP